MIAFTNLTKKRRPSLPWEKAKEMVLNKSYDLSVVFSGDSLTRKLNKKYRGKDKPANVLSFPLSDKEGEIFINLSHPHQTPTTNSVNKERLLHLFIHSLLHLKGLSHGDKMEDEEERLLKKFK